MAWQVYANQVFMWSSIDQTDTSAHLSLSFIVIYAIQCNAQSWNSGFGRSGFGVDRTGAIAWWLCGKRNDDHDTTDFECNLNIRTRIASTTEDGSGNRNEDLLFRSCCCLLL